jgi:hypothetical protein
MGSHVAVGVKERSHPKLPTLSYVCKNSGETVAILRFLSSLHEGDDADDGTRTLVKTPPHGNLTIYFGRRIV